MVSEYSSTASVFSSCAGTGASTSACIHWGASPLAAADGAHPRTHSSIAGRSDHALPLVAGAGRFRLQYNLCFITCPHCLEETPQGWIILPVEQHNIDAQFPGYVQRSL